MYDFKIPSKQKTQATETVTTSIASTPVERLGFRYVWPVKVSTRQLSSNETIILQISPKFATVHDHVSFQWTLKMQGTANIESSESEDDNEDVRDESETSNENGERTEQDYVAILLYYVDGPVSTVELQANVRIVGEKECVVEEKKTDVTVSRGRECELAFTGYRAHLSNYIKDHLGQLIRLSLQLEMDSSLFKTDAYLNAVSPTPIHSFLTANYRARASSKVWKRRSRQHPNKRPRSASDGQPNKKLDLERAFNRVMDQERERREDCKDCMEHNNNNNINSVEKRRGSLTASFSAGPVLTKNITTSNSSITEDTQQQQQHQQGSGPHIRFETNETGSGGQRLPTFANQPPDQHLFKKLLVACCDSCERRASLILPPASSRSSSNGEEDSDDSDAENNDENETVDNDGNENAAGDDEEDNSFECPEENKAEIHDVKRNLFFIYSQKAP